ncbi:hypothetical protein BDR22DRAFT_855393 [Usnea florida]
MDDNNRAPLTKGPAIHIPSEPSTVDYKAQDTKDDSEYQVLWSKKMDEGKKYNRSSTYTNAAVLLLSWDEACDDLAVKEEVSKLQNTLRGRFNFHTQISNLDTKNEKRLQVQVNLIVANFIATYDGPNTLLIVYYAGHGRPGDRYGHLELHGQTSANDQIKRLDTLVWNKTEMLLSNIESDVLEIFDCCYAGNLGLVRGDDGLFEYLAATREMSTTRGPGNKSFTEALIYSLEALEKEKGRFTTVELLNHIKDHAPNFPKNQTPVLSDRKSNGQAGRIMLHPIRQTPNGPISTSSTDECTIQDAFKRRTVTLHIDFCDQPSLTDIDTLGTQFNHLFERSSLSVNQIRWGGMQGSAALRALGNFQAGRLKRSRRVSMEQQQARLDMVSVGRWSSEKTSDLLTPSSSKSHSPDFPSSQGSHDESDEGQVSSRGVRNKKPKFNNNNNCEKAS